MGKITWTMPSGKTWTTDPPPIPPDPPAEEPSHVTTMNGDVLTGNPMIDDPPPF